MPCVCYIIIIINNNEKISSSFKKLRVISYVIQINLGDEVPSERLSKNKNIAEAF